MCTYCHLKQQKKRFMIDFVVSSILCILDSNDTVYLDKMGIVKKRLFFFTVPFCLCRYLHPEMFLFQGFFIAKIHERGVVEWQKRQN